MSVQMISTKLDMSNVLALILGGGQGTRLYPLTRDRAKPAVPLAGKYRLIDIPMSNCLHAGIERIAILTQFNSASLHRHIYRTYTRDTFAKGWVQILAAEQSFTNRDWYQGTADAVRKQWVEIEQADSEYVVILAGDHLYRMDYRDFVLEHISFDADVTIAVQPCSRQDAPALGILKMDEQQKIQLFKEKPQTKEELDELTSLDDKKKPYLASMGIYVFKTKVLRELLNHVDGDDFGKNIIPTALKKHNVYAHIFRGFWEDIGTIRRFYEVNLALAQKNPPFDFYDPVTPIYTRPRFLPGSEVYGASMENVVIADGCHIASATVRNCMIGLRSRVGDSVTMTNTVMMGADYFESESDRKENKKLGRPDIGIGSGAVIDNAIIDKNARIGKGVIIRKLDDRENEENENWVIKDNLVIIPKNGIIPDGTII